MHTSTGMPTQTLRSIVTYETVLPVATVFLTNVALGVMPELRAKWTVRRGSAD